MKLYRFILLICISSIFSSCVGKKYLFDPQNLGILDFLQWNCLQWLYVITWIITAIAAISQFIISRPCSGEEEIAVHHRINSNSWTEYIGTGKYYHYEGDPQGGWLASKFVFSFYVTILMFIWIVPGMFQIVAHSNLLLQILMGILCLTLLIINIAFLVSTFIGKWIMNILIVCCYILAILDIIVGLWKTYV